MCRNPLVELDEFVDLGTVEPAAVLHELLEAIPGVAVCEHERVDVHHSEPSGDAGSAGSPKLVAFSMSEVVTGDAVVLDVQIAQLPVRALSAFIDIAVIVIGYLVALVLWAATLTQFDDAP